MNTYHRLKKAALSAAAELRILKRLRTLGIVTPLNTPQTDKLRAELRNNARHTNLARGFFKGLPYAEIERPLRPKNEGHITSKGQTRTHPDWDKLAAILVDSGVDQPQAFAEWRDAALNVTHV